MRRRPRKRAELDRSSGRTRSSRAREPRRCAPHPGVVAVEHRDSRPASWRANSARLGLAVLVEVGVAVEMVGGEVEQDADARPEASPPTRAGSSTPRRPHVARRPLDAPSTSGVPRLPPTNDAPARGGAACAPSSAVVVLLPLVPVMATIGTAQRARRELDLAPAPGCRARRAALSSGAVARHARARHDQIDAVEQRRRPRGRSAASTATPASSTFVVEPEGRGRRRRAPARLGAARQRAPPRAPVRPSTDDQNASGAANVDASSQLERAERDQRAEDRDDPEADDDLRLGPAQQLEVMVDRRHAEDALAPRA